VKIDLPFHFGPDGAIRMDIDNYLFW